MKEITILSGKGGTGKTSITAALASVAKNTVFCDNDVDASDLHLILKPEILERNTFHSGWKATINNQKCTACDLCTDYCRFDAIRKTKTGSLYIDPFKCEGCRLCERICPEKAISSLRNDNNVWYVSSTRFGHLVHARMAPGEENSGKLVTAIRKRARVIASETGADFILNDGPPGIGCPTISSLTGTNFVLLVIEPSRSALHDAARLTELVSSFSISSGAVINKYTINETLALETEKYLRINNIPLLARIPFDKSIVEAMIQGKSIIEFNPGSGIAGSIEKLWKKLISLN